MQSKKKKNQANTHLILKLGNFKIKPICIKNNKS